MGSGFRTFASGEVLTAANVNNYLMEQAVMSFASSTARDAAVTSPEEGMTAYLQDINSITVYSGSAWVTIADLEVLVVDSANTRVGINQSVPTDTLDVNGTVNIRDYVDFRDTPGSSGNEIQVFPHSYSLYVDNTGSGSANSRVWLDSPDEGEIIFGPRSGASECYLIRLRSETINLEGDTNVSGALTKTSGSFRIVHPLPSMAPNHDLVHSFVEAPEALNLYRGRAELVAGVATVNLDDASTMTEGTFVALNRDVQVFTTNEESWCPIRASVAGNILTIEAQDDTCTDTISWLVCGQRQDHGIMASTLTDDDGRIIVEPVVDRTPDSEPLEDTP